MSDDISERVFAWIRNNKALMQKNQANVDPYDLGCADCGCDTRSEYYMVHDDLWLDAGMPLGYGGGLLCVRCLEERIGRRLRASDFTDAPVNRIPWGKSGCLLARLIASR